MTLGRLTPLRRHEGRPDELSDAALVAACALGDPPAMGALIDRFQRPVYRFVSRLLGSDGSDRDDVVQTTFFEVSRSAARFANRSSVKVWIFGIAANVTRNHIRSLSRRRRMHTTLATVPEAPSDRPDDLLQRRELVNRARLALTDLPHDLREAFVLCELEQMTAREAAMSVGVREGTIWRRVHEARQALRAAIEGTTP